MAKKKLEKGKNWKRDEIGSCQKLFYNIQIHKKSNKRVQTKANAGG